MLRKTIGDGISSSTALSVESRGRQNNKQNNMRRSPTRGRSRSRSRGKSKSKGITIVCWNYNKECHKKNDCTEPKKKKGAGEDKVMTKGQTWLIRTVKRTPQENGMAERMNRTIMERARDVIFDESRLYKHKLQEHGIEKDNKEFMELDEPEDGQVPRIENPEVLDETINTEIGPSDQQQMPETLNLRRSCRIEVPGQNRFYQLVDDHDVSSMFKVYETKDVIDVYVTGVEAVPQMAFNPSTVDSPIANPPTSDQPHVETPNVESEGIIYVDEDCNEEEPRDIAAYSFPLVPKTIAFAKVGVAPENQQFDRGKSHFFGDFKSADSSTISCLANVTFVVLVSSMMMMRVQCLELNDT
ncbi:hypothetical protein RJ639_043173 [Escallonia herrerae]|uniref:Integrase catalytic domain-containing protein n=1 Tax=Escallonia herrerae TaxID=1293975 RepID=A0AA88WB91_9ASTE|nr:hypothetical protein RJ639_043173 [Escallonia herrerae]